MYRLGPNDFFGDPAFAVHTGMRSFDAPICWKASQAEEGVLIASDGTMHIILPGSELRLDNRSSGLQHDLFRFNRKGTLTGRIGAGGVRTPDGTIIGGFGEFRCSLLMARRCVPVLQTALHSGLPFSRVVADLIRPALLRSLESAAARVHSVGDMAALRNAIENATLHSIHTLLIHHGLKPESLTLEWIGPTEENHEKHR